MFGLDQVGLAYGDNLVIQGMGGLGLCAVAVAKARGARVLAVDGVPIRLEQARAFGADEIIDTTEVSTPQARAERVADLTAGRGADVGLEVAGVPAAVAEGIHLVRRGGRYLIMGNVWPGQTIALDPGLLTRRALQVMTIDRYDARYLWKALTFLDRQSDRYPFARLLDAEFSLDDVETALIKSANREVTRASIVM
jgi:threonine dehydrogenase-like Zn-dependent dehydrogenase